MNATEHIPVNEASFEMIAAINTDAAIHFPQSQIARRYHELARDLIEWEGWIDVYQWNRTNFKITTSLKANGETEILNEALAAFDCHTHISAAIANISAAGSTLAEESVVIAKSLLGENSPQYTEFNDTRQGIHASDFSYYLIDLLRNHSQHRQIIIATHHDEDGRAHSCIDLNQLLDTRHFAFNKQDRLKKIRERISNEYDAAPKINLLATMEAYNVSLLRICASFLTSIESKVKDINERFRRLILKDKQHLVPLGDGGYIVFYIEEDMAHVVSDPLADLEKSLKNLQRKVQGLLREGERNLSQAKLDFGINADQAEEQ